MTAIVTIVGFIIWVNVLAQLIVQPLLFAGVLIIPALIYGLLVVFKG